jgi:hypothetical protein
MAVLWVLLLSYKLNSTALDRLCGLVVRIDSWHYQIFWEVVGLERAPLSLVSTIEELLGEIVAALV